MNDVELERRLRRWMSDREPGPVPMQTRAELGQVAFKTPIPTSRRLVDPFVRRVSPPRTQWAAGPVRAMLLVLGLLVAVAVAALFVAGSKPPAPVLETDSWGAFVVGRAAPPAVMRLIPPVSRITDDDTLEFVDLAGSIVVLVVPDEAAGSALNREIEALTVARHRTGADVVFLVGARSAAVTDALSRVAAETEDIDAVDLSSASAVAFPSGAPALVVVDRQGGVAAIFAGVLPGADQLVTLIKHLEDER